MDLLSILYCIIHTVSLVNTYTYIFNPVLLGLHSLHESSIEDGGETLFGIDWVISKGECS